MVPTVMVIGKTNKAIAIPIIDFVRCRVRKANASQV